MTHRQSLLAALIAVAGLCQAQTEAPLPVAEPALTAEQEDRYQHVIDELRCLVCQNQTIAESSAPLAQDLRLQVKTQIASGRSDGEIRRYLTERYGDFVLYRPPLRARTLLLWFGPALLVLGALAAALVHMRQTQARAVAPSADPEALRRLLEERP